MSTADLSLRAAADRLLGAASFHLVIEASSQTEGYRRVRGGRKDFMYDKHAFTADIPGQPHPHHRLYAVTTENLMRYLEALKCQPGTFDGDEYVVHYVMPYEGRATDHIDIELRARIANGSIDHLSTHVVMDRYVSDVAYAIDEVHP